MGLHHSKQGQGKREIFSFVYLKEADLYAKTDSGTPIPKDNLPDYPIIHLVNQSTQNIRIVLSKKLAERRILEQEEKFEANAEIFACGFGVGGGGSVEKKCIFQYPDAASVHCMFLAAGQQAMERIDEGPVYVTVFGKNKQLQEVLIFYRCFSSGDRVTIMKKHTDAALAY